MMYVDFTAGNKEYKLRLNTRNVIELEKQLGFNPVLLFGSGDRVPTITEMVHVLHASLKQYNHGISLNDAFNIFDDYLAENTQNDFYGVIIELYQCSGLVPKAENSEKN